MYLADQVSGKSTGEIVMINISKKEKQKQIIE
jgi:hypothetical protein